MNLATEQKIIFAGSVGAGKTTAIESISDIPLVRTEQRATDETARRKSSTTVAMDYGVLHLEDGSKVHLYGSPGQDRFDFMWDILTRGGIGLVLLIDNARADPLADLEHYLAAFKNFISEREVVIGVTRMDVKPRPGLYTYHTRLAELGMKAPLFEVDARRREDVKMLLLALLTMLDPGLQALTAQADMPSGSVLSLRGFGVAFGERVVLSDVTLEVPGRGVTILMGPAGTGKSTLLRTLAGFNAANPSHRCWGEAVYAGAPLGSEERPAMVTQSARLMMASVLENLVHDLPERATLTHLQQRDLARRLLQYAGLDELAGRLDRAVVKLPLGVQRHLAILRLAAASPRLLCLDEPTSGLEPSESESILGYIARESRRRAMLVVLHSQEQADRLGGHTALLAGGRIQEHRATAEFFADPRSAPAREFVRNGCCAVPSPDAQPDELDAGVPAPPPLPAEARACVSDTFGPRGFLWLKKGVLAGTPRPGVVRDIDYDLGALRRVGVTALVSLTRTAVDAALLADYGIRGIWSPIADMQAPTLRQGAELCQTIEALIAEGNVVAVHCRAGLGRTGTVLAAYLIWEGRSALDALESVRRIEPRWVQSEAQVAFLEEFARSLAHSRARHPRARAQAARSRAGHSVPSN